MGTADSNRSVFVSSTMFLATSLGPPHQKRHHIHCRPHAISPSISLRCVTAAGGHDQVMQMLLDNGAGVNAQGGSYTNALQAASAGGHDQVVQMLLDQGTDVNVQGGSSNNANQERPSDQDNKETYSYQGSLESSIIEDRTSARFRTDFVSPLRPPTTYRRR